MTNTVEVQDAVISVVTAGIQGPAGPTSSGGFDLQFTLEFGIDDTFTLHQYASFGYTIDKAYYKTDSGTITAAIKIEATDITGLSALSISSTEGNSTASAANTMAVGNTLTVVLINDATASNVSITLHCTKL